MSPSSSTLQATYLIETPLDPRAVAEVLAGEQSSGTFLRVAGEIYLMALVVHDIWTAEPDESEWTEEDWAEVDAVSRGDLDRVALAQVDGVERGGREPHPDLDGLPDLRDVDPGR